MGPQGRQYVKKAGPKREKQKWTEIQGIQSVQSMGTYRGKHEMRGNLNFFTGGTRAGVEGIWASLKRIPENSQNSLVQLAKAFQEELLNFLAVGRGDEEFDAQG
jgi:hypothetical protein